MSKEESRAVPIRSESLGPLKILIIAKGQHTNEGCCIMPSKEA